MPLDFALKRLLNMGMFDWEKHDVLHPAARLAMRHNVAIQARVLPRIFEVEDQVRIPHSIGDLCWLMRILFR